MYKRQVYTYLVNAHWSLEQKKTYTFVNLADPYSSRQRRSNENRNGMIRRYPPKRSEIRMDMAGELREIVDEADNRPMRVLDYRTPAEAFADELLELQDQQGCCTSK